MPLPEWLKDKQKKSAGSSSDSEASGGYKFKYDPTVPANHRAVVGPDGKRAALIKKVGDKWAGDWDNYSQKFASSQAALRQLAMSKKMKKSSDK